MNIYRFEMKAYLRSAAIWSLCVFLLIFLFMSLFPSFSKDTALLDSVVKNYPEAMLKAFGMGGALPLSSLFGYIAMTYVYVQLCLAVQSANYGFACLSAEERELTADFLLTKPVTRSRIVLNKLFAAVTALLITNAVAWASMFGSLKVFGGNAAYDVLSLTLLLASGFVFQLFFLSVGMLVSVCVKKIRSVLSFSLGLSFVLYIAYALRAVFGGEFFGGILLALLTPFYHFDASYILENGSYDMPYFYLEIAVIVVSLVISYLLYLRRNIHSV